MTNPSFPRAARSLTLLASSCCVLLAWAGAALGATAPPAASKLGAALERRVVSHPEDRVAVWVEFTDRGGREHDPAWRTMARRALSARSLERRARRGGLGGVLESDLPVHAPYVRALVVRGARLRGTSRWLNAASVETTAGAASEIARLPFVARVEIVAGGRRSEPVGAPLADLAARRARAAPGAAGVERLLAVPGDPAWYGASYNQLAISQVPQLHASGLSGAGVLVCVLDTGFHVGHDAYAGLDLIAQRDFIHQDTNVDDEPGEDLPGQHSHGTMTLACVAGSLPGVYSGAAFGASVALAKTENNASETPAEMDYWQFAAEWADSLGADVISSSLGYSTFDNPNDSYDYSDMDGRTTVVTRAASEAARRGIVVVTAAGNQGNRPWHYIIAPGDADTVITAGAVDSNNVVAGFSSRGPTADGRIKPDVCAMGVNTLTVSPTDDSSFVRVNGTSFSTPLTAGMVALLLEAHPAWGPFEVREALRETALNHATPNNDLGWGLIQAAAARSWVPSTTGVGSDPIASDQIELAAGPNPAAPGERLTIRFTLPRSDRATLDVLDLGGRRLARLFAGDAAGHVTVSWNGRGADGAPLAAGVYWVRVTTAGSGSRAVRLALLR